MPVSGNAMPHVWNPRSCSDLSPIPTPIHFFWLPCQIKQQTYQARWISSATTAQLSPALRYLICERTGRRGAAQPGRKLQYLGQVDVAAARQTRDLKAEGGCGYEDSVGRTGRQR